MSGQCNLALHFRVAVRTLAQRSTGRHTNPHAETRAIVLLSVSGRIKPTLVSRRILSAVARSPLVLPLAGWALGASVVNLHATSQKGEVVVSKRKGRGRVVGSGH